MLFNSLLVQSNPDLAEIARLLGDDPGEYEDWAELTAAGLDAKLWSEPDALYVDYDLEPERHVAARTAAGLAPLHAGVPTPERARRMVERLAGVPRRGQRGGGWAVTSLAPDDPGFLPTRYWRGPIWPILNWALQRGLDRYGYDARRPGSSGADRPLEPRRVLGALRPAAGAGQGGESFAWTAGLVLDVLATEMESEEEGGRAHGRTRSASRGRQCPIGNERRE